MRALAVGSVPQWHIVAGRCCPEGIDTRCPNRQCDRLVTFRLRDVNFDQHRNALAGTGRCPGCGNDAYFWVVNPRTNVSEETRCDALYMYPLPRVTREPIIPPDVLQPKTLERAYLSAIQAYNTGLWDPCATSCGKTLEGIVKTLYPGTKGQLFDQLQEFFSKHNVAEPLVHLTDTLRKGRNIGAHFDLEKQADHEVATLMLDLLDYFLEFLFLLKEKSKDLEGRLNSLGAPSP